MSTLVEAAVLLAQRGHRIFPVNADKSPRTPNGHHDGTTDVSIVASWPWDGGIGLVVPERTFVLDVDPRNGGVETLRTLTRLNYRLPATRLVKTQSGGHHYYYALPDDRDLRGKLGPGVDIKKPGRGYVLIPPTPGYTYLRGGKPAPAPEWLLEELTLERKAAGAASGPKFYSFEGGTGYGLAALTDEVRKIREAEEGNRRANLNARAFLLAQLVAGGELDEDKTLEAIFDAALASGLTERQALNAMRSGWKAGLQKPRGAA